MEESSVVGTGGWSPEGPGWLESTRLETRRALAHGRSCPQQHDNGLNRFERRLASALSINVSILAEDSDGPPFMSGKLCPTPCTVRSNRARFIGTKSRTELDKFHVCVVARRQLDLRWTATGIAHRDSPVAEPGQEPATRPIRGRNWRVLWKAAPPLSSHSPQRVPPMLPLP